ncbi:MAG: oligosaccharide flippase family protein, partial [Halobacteriaceae archaeon]
MIESDDSDEESAVATVASGGTLVLSSKVVSLGLGFLTQLAMARLLTETQYGEIVLTIAIINVFALAAKLGIDDGVIRQFPNYEDKPAKVQGVIRASLFITIGSSAAVAVIAFSVAPILSERIYNNQSLTLLIRISSVGIPFIVVSSVIVSLARGARDARPHAYVNQISKPFMRFLFISVLVVFGFGAVGGIIGHTIASILASLLALYIGTRVLPSFDSASVPDRMYRTVLGFSLPLVAFQGVGFINSNVDIYMIGYFLNSSSVGIYNISL